MQHLGIPLEDLNSSSRNSSDNESRRSSINEGDGILGVSANESLLADWLQDDEAVNSSTDRPRLSLQIPRSSSHQSLRVSPVSGTPLSATLSASPTSRSRDHRSRSSSATSVRLPESPKPPRPILQMEPTRFDTPSPIDPDAIDQRPHSLYSHSQFVLDDDEYRPRGRTLFIFHDTSKLRRFFFNMHSTQGYYILRIGLTLLQVAVLQYETARGVVVKTGSSFFNEWVNNIYFVLYLFYTFHILSHMIAFGAVTNRVIGLLDLKIGFHRWYRWFKREVLNSHEHIQQASIHDDMDEVDAALQKDEESRLRDEMHCEPPTLRKSWNRVELAAVLCFWLGMPSMAKFDDVPLTWQMFYGLAHMRLFWLLSLWSHTQVIYHSLKVAFPLLTDVFIFISLFAMAFTVAGLQSFSGSLDRVCVWVDPTGQSDNYTTSQLCGSYIDATTNVTMPFIDMHGHRSGEAKGYSCPRNSLCMELEGQYDGTLSFDNIFNSLEIVFVVMSTNTYSDIMYMIVASESAAASVFFMAGIVILNYWMLSLLVSILSSSFDIAWAARPKKKETRFVRKLRMWFQTEHFLVTIKRSKHQLWNKIYSALYPIWPLLIALDVCFQAAWSPLDDSVFKNNFLYYWQMAISFLLLLEIAFRMVLFFPQWQNFFRSVNNLVDAALAVINVSTVWLYYSNPDVYAWLTVFQLLRFYRFVALFPVAERMTTLVFGNLEQLWKLTCFYFLCTYFASMVVCRMYIGQMPYTDPDEGGVAPVSFFNLGNAFFGMYQISSTENWTAVMYYIVQNASGVAAQAMTAALFCIWLAFSNFIVVNLFIAVMSSRFQTNKSNMRQEQVRRFVADTIRAPVSESDREFARQVQRILNPSISKFIKKVLTGQPISFKRKPGKKNPLEKLNKIAERELLAEFLKLNEFRPNEDETATATMFNALSKNVIITAPLRVIKQTLQIFDREYNYHRYIERHSGGGRHNYVSTWNWKRKPQPGANPKQAVTFGDLPSARETLHEDEENEPVRPVAESDSQDGSAESPNSSGPLSPPMIHRDQTDEYLEGLFTARNRTRTEIFERAQAYPNYDRSLGIFSIGNPLRKLCQRIVPSNRGQRASGIEPNRWVWFGVWVLTLLCSVAVVVVSCVNTPIYHIEHTKSIGYKQSSWTWITYLDLVFAGIFLLEFFIKVIADGFHYTPNAYTYSPWNIVDLLVLLSMLVTIINNILSGPVSRYSRAIMAFRALRLISVTPKSEQVFTSVFFSGLGRISVAAFVGLSVVFPYSVWGLNVFHNKLAYCSDGDIDNLSECIGEYMSSPSNWDVWAPRYKTNPYFDYDSFGQAMLIQFGVLSLEGWIDVLNAVISIQGPGLAANKTFNFNYNALYPILYNFIGTVLIMTMFLSTIIRNYAMSRKTAFMTPEQLTWHYMKRSLRELRPKVQVPNYSPGTLRYVLLQAISNPRSLFSVLEVLVIVMLTIVFFIYHHNMNEAFSNAYYYIVAVLALVNTSLLFIRLWILGWDVYKKDRWNIYAIVVSMCLSAFTLALIREQVVITALQRTATLFAVGFWIAKIPTVRRLFRAATENKAELATITNTYFILFLTFAIAFNQTFGITKLGESGSSVENFRTVPSALILLFKMSTGEGWNEIMVDYTINSPYCTAGNMFFESDCGSKAAAYILFIAWNLISMYVFANLFISVIYDTFWYLYRQTHISITSEDLRLYQQNWLRYDPKSKGYIYSEDLDNFMRTSKGYFSLGIYSDDPDYNLRTILERTGARRSHVNLYDVDFDSIKTYLNDLPVDKFAQKRKLYELFCLQAMYDSETGLFKRKIRFQSLLLQFPLYKDMDPAKVMELNDFVALKVELYQLRLILAANFIITRWRNRDNFKRRQGIPSIIIEND